MHNIVFFGGHHWDTGAWFRKQQFAYRLYNKGHAILYVEKHHQRRNYFNIIQYFTYSVTKKNDKLIIFTPPSRLPLSHRNKYFNSLYNILLFYILKRVLNRNHFKTSLVWLNRIELNVIASMFKCPIIFDLVDDIPYYNILANNFKQYKLSLYYLQRSIKSSKIQIVTAQKLIEKYFKDYENDVIKISNGHNIDLQTLPDHIPVPDEVKKIKKPIIGFIGTLFRFIDGDLLSFLIKSRPNYSYVFVGKIETNFPLENISNFDNVHILGEKPKSSIVNYISSFDICLNPFKKHEVNDSVSPVKVFEYLAQKKVVVSTEMYSLMKEDISQHIHFGSTKEEILAIIDAIIIKQNYVNNIPEQVLLEYHWDNLFNKLVSSIEYNMELSL